MKKFSLAVMFSIMAIVMVLCLSVFASDYENLSVTTLRIGNDSQLVSGSPTALLESMLGGTGAVTRVKSTDFSGPLLSTPATTFRFFDDFLTISKSTNVVETTTMLAPWSYTGDGGILTDFTIGASAGGILKMITGATSNNEAYIQYGSTGTCGAFGVTSNGTKHLWFETRAAGSAPLVNASTFIGLAAPGSSAANFIVDSTGAIANTNYMGFQCTIASTNTYWNFVIHGVGQTAQVCTNVAKNSGTGTYNRLGFIFDGVNTITVYSNGTANARTFTINDTVYPTTAMMAPIIASKSLSLTYSPTNLIDYISVIQDR